MARFQAAPIFGDGMVLQRGKNINVFGTGEDGVLVKVELCGFETSCVVTNGKWKVVFPPMGACRYMNMTLTDEETGDYYLFADVAIGEVWLAGGGSNMEMELWRSEGGEDALANDDAKDVRYFQVPRSTVHDENHVEELEKAAWSQFGENESTRSWSAAAYYCAKEMSDYLDVTVGMIGCNWEGTSASCWIDRAYARGGASWYFNEYDANMEGHTVEEAIAEYRKYKKERGEWEKKREELLRNNPSATKAEIIAACGEDKFPGPMAPNNPHAPGVLFESMVKYVAPYTLGGVMWYQGEADEKHPNVYYTLLYQVIRNWREAWHDDSLAFIIGQLPMYGGDDPEGESWCLIREAQLRIYNTIKNTGFAVLADCGDKDKICSANKRTVGHRFAMQALDIVYDGCDGAFAPTIKGAVWRGETVELQFDNSRGGFVVKGEPDGFEICGEDGVYKRAYADVSGERIFVSADDIKNPCGVRYLWKNYAPVKIFSAFNLPLAPFRIDKLWNN